MVKGRDRVAQLRFDRFRKLASFLVHPQAVFPQNMTAAQDGIDRSGRCCDAGYSSGYIQNRGVCQGGNNRKDSAGSSDPGWNPEPPSSFAEPALQLLFDLCIRGLLQERELKLLQDDSSLAQEPGQRCPHISFGVAIELVLNTIL